MGLLYDPYTGRNRVVYAFCGVLAHSRLPFIQFVFTQDQVSYCQSIVDMLKYYGGATQTFVIDNLKAGVIKPDVWDPKLNRSLQELTEYYGIFVDTARVASPQDKPKVERFVPVARETYRMLKKLHPTYTREELNQKALQWCVEEYGEKEHGTTGVPPIAQFKNHEQKKLIPLPARRFEVPRWKEVLVHPDQFFSIDKKRYSLPNRYIGMNVWVRQSNNIIRIFHHYKLLREYIIPKKKSYAYEESDFPEGLRYMMKGAYPRYILNAARSYGESAYKLVERVLKPHAYLNARRARGMLDVFKTYHGDHYFDEICERAREKNIKVPSTLKKFFKSESRQLHLGFMEPLSPRGQEMVRDINYYIN